MLAGGLTVSANASNYPTDCPDEQDCLTAITEERILEIEDDVVASQLGGPGISSIYLDGMLADIDMSQVPGGPNLPWNIKIEEMLENELS